MTSLLQYGITPWLASTNHTASTSREAFASRRSPTTGCASVLAFICVCPHRSLTLSRLSQAPKIVHHGHAAGAVPHNAAYGPFWLEPERSPLWTIRGGLWSRPPKTFWPQRSSRDLWVRHVLPLPAPGLVFCPTTRWDDYPRRRRLRDYHGTRNFQKWNYFGRPLLQLLLTAGAFCLPFGVYLCVFAPIVPPGRWGFCAPAHKTGHLYVGPPRAAPYGEPRTFPARRHVGRLRRVMTAPARGLTKAPVCGKPPRADIESAPTGNRCRPFCGLYVGWRTVGVHPANLSFNNNRRPSWKTSPAGGGLLCVNRVYLLILSITANSSGVNVVCSTALMLSRICCVLEAPIRTVVTSSWCSSQARAISARV